MPDSTRSRRSLYVLLCCAALLLVGSVTAAAGRRADAMAGAPAGAAAASPLPSPADPVVVAAAPPGTTPAPVASDPAAEPLPSVAAAAQDRAPVPSLVEPAPVAPAPPAPALPAQEPAPVPAPTTSPLERVQAMFLGSVPAAWRDAVPVRFELVDGPYSWANHDGTIQVSVDHAGGQVEILQAAVAHEFGHLIAYQYGSQAFNGAAPAGWPAYSDRPEEAWADCVGQAFIGFSAPSHGLPACNAASLSWTLAWLAVGPGAHPVTA
jgi:hypothetical protein